MVVKNAHMVSKSYIRAWADGKNVVDVIDLQDGRGYPSSYLSATVVSYVYDPEVLTRDLERDYGRIEDRGIPAIVKLRKGVTLTAAERTAVIAFPARFRKLLGTLASLAPDPPHSNICSILVL